MTQSLQQYGIVPKESWLRAGESEDALWDRLLNSDLTTCVRAGGLPADIASLSVVIQGPVLVQLDECSDISLPVRECAKKIAAGGTGWNGPKTRMLKLFLTDGITSVIAFETSYCPALDAAAPGCKLLLRNFDVRYGHIQLRQNSCHMLGGEVQHLVELDAKKWKNNMLAVVGKAYLKVGAPAMLAIAPPTVESRAAGETRVQQATMSQFATAPPQHPPSVPNSSTHSVQRPAMTTAGTQQTGLSQNQHRQQQVPHQPASHQVPPPPPFQPRQHVQLSGTMPAQQGHLQRAPQTGPSTPPPPNNSAIIQGPQEPLAQLPACQPRTTVEEIQREPLTPGTNAPSEPRTTPADHNGASQPSTPSTSEAASISLLPFAYISQIISNRALLPAEVSVRAYFAGTNSLFQFEHGSFELEVIIDDGSSRLPVRLSDGVLQGFLGCTAPELIAIRASGPGGFEEKTSMLVNKLESASQMMTMHLSDQIPTVVSIRDLEEADKKLIFKRVAPIMPAMRKSPEPAAQMLCSYVMKRMKG
ncbi:RecQ-mediated genome instability protein 1 [Diplonema papillatum]|nr:RecQ-mediated genome instability protein 1 [Diplonema papillatum]